MISRPKRLASPKNDPKAGDMEPDILHGAMQNDEGEVRAALDLNPNCVNQQDFQFKYTATHIAASQGNLTLVNLLISRQEFNWEVKDIYGRDVLDVAILAGHPGVVSAVTAYRAQMLGLTPPKKADILPFKPS